MINALKVAAVGTSYSQFQQLAKSDKAMKSGKLSEQQIQEHLHQKESYAQASRKQALSSLGSTVENLGQSLFSLIKSAFHLVKGVGSDVVKAAGSAFKGKYQQLQQGPVDEAQHGPEKALTGPTFRSP